ncbi:unnamed protein product [Spirodela intermedia]|uniref:Uncharacterized protein n=1 Tax=Spirodela intermedia TaxID=51605 RepID=A0A7I8KC06_SPIIN|nr:unnamed protein product [Spirodela intermedia]
MEIFENARTVRLRSHHGKYLMAEGDEFSVTQARNGSNQRTWWAWEPIRDGPRVRFRSHLGKFLRANGGLPPWRGSVTHDVPTRDCVLWHVDVLETEFRSETSSSSLLSIFLSKSDGRTIRYAIADEDGLVDERSLGASCKFSGRSVEDLRRKLQEETGVSDVLVCSRSPLTGRLHPLFWSAPRPEVIIARSRRSPLPSYWFLFPSVKSRFSLRDQFCRVFFQRITDKAMFCMNKWHSGDWVRHIVLYVIQMMIFYNHGRREVLPHDWFDILSPTVARGFEIHPDFP